MSGFFSSVFGGSRSTASAPAATAAPAAAAQAAAPPAAPVASSTSAMASLWAFPAALWPGASSSSSSNSNGGGGGGGGASAVAVIASLPTSAAAPAGLPPGVENVTRAHWVPDAQATFCSIKGCGQLFGWLERRHHCRRCGEAVCSTHFVSTLRLNQRAVPDPDGWPCPVCDECFLQFKRRELLSADGGVARTDETRVYYAMPDPGPILIPDIINPTPTSTVYLGSILMHLTDLVNYFDGVRNAIAQARDSMVKREYMQIEKQHFNASVKAVDEHLATLAGVVTYGSVDPQLREFLRACTTLIEGIKAWALSTDVFLLLSGVASTGTRLGELPEEDFAKVEARVSRNEGLAESLLATLFDVTPAEQQEALQKLTHVRAAMQHDYDEYQLIGGPEMLSFMARLEKSIEYIDMHVEMCTGDMQLLDMQSNLTAYEQTFFALMSEGEKLTPGANSATVASLKQRFVDLIRDVAVFRNLLQKSDQAVPTKSVTRAATPNGFAALIPRVDELENNMRQLETMFEEKFKVEPEVLRSDATERFKSLQKHRSAHQREEIEEDLFAL